MLQISSKEVTPGFSGAPVLDEATRRVVGMVTAVSAPDQYGRLAETAFITPTKTLLEVCPKLRPSDVQPYRGLAAFVEADSEFFFGRQRLVARLVESLGREPRFLAVLGPSGSGKSSVVQVGLIPKLRRGAVPGSDIWEPMVVRPADRPFENLEEEGLKGASRGLVKAAGSFLDADRSRLFLVLDQFEEFLVTCPEEARRQFLVQLTELLESDLPVTVVLVMRDEFFSRLAREAPAPLFQWVEEGFVHISLRLEEDELKEMILRPAEKVGLEFEEGLAEAIVNDVLETGYPDGGRAGRSTVLPLLEFSLTQLWERRREGVLTHEAYAAVGG